MDYTDLQFLESFTSTTRVSDFAQLYFANYSRPETATKMFRKRIRESKSLYEKLIAADYNEKDRYLNSIHIRIIVSAWGAPQAYKRKHDILN